MSRRKIRAFVSQHLQDPALRASRLGYDVTYSRTASKEPDARWRYREILNGRNKDFTKIRLVITWMKSGNPEIEWLGSVRDQGGLEMKFFNLREPSYFWMFAESNGKCPCGKKIFSQSGASEVVDNCTRKRIFEGSVKRKEDRFYNCHILRDVFHVTSTDLRG